MTAVTSRHRRWAAALLGLLATLSACTSTHSVISTTTKAVSPRSTTTAPTPSGVPSIPLSDSAANAPTNADDACLWDVALATWLAEGGGRREESRSTTGAGGEHYLEEIASFADAAAANFARYSILRADADAGQAWGRTAPWGVLNKVTSSNPELLALSNDCKTFALP